jgi:hypothetical protein
VSATNPSDPYSSAPVPARRFRWLWAVIAVVVIAGIAVVAYMLFSGGGGGYGGGGGAGGGYAVVAFSGETIRRVARRLKRSRTGPEGIRFSPPVEGPRWPVPV